MDRIQNGLNLENLPNTYLYVSEHSAPFNPLKKTI